MRDVGIMLTGALVALVALSGCARQSQAPSMKRPGMPAPAMSRADRSRDALSNLNHPVATSNAEAQRHFNEGLTQVYAFNHDEAVKCFKKALEADPKLAMAHWGIALALGPNYNVDVDDAREKQGYEEIHKAMEMSSESPQVEKDYIAALAKRFSNQEKPDLKKLARDYAAAMGELSKKYPDDLDAATLYADSMMNLRPWHLWTKEYKPEEGTLQIVSTLESVLKRDPDHIGANHLYIHATEASAHPERALEAAARLPVLAPTCGHLVHMPSHVYARVGDNESAATSNDAAVSADREYFSANPDMGHGVYNMLYYSHNMHFLAYANEQQGNYKEAIKWANMLPDRVKPHLAEMAMLEAFCTVPEMVQVRCRKWDEILASPAPDAKAMPITAALWHFARGMAYASKGQTDQANGERDAMMAIKQGLAPDTPFAMLNKAHQVLEIANDTLRAKIADRQKQWSEAERLLRKAAETQDDLAYIEPPDWLLNSRENLGGVLLRSGDAAGAEKVFREDLDKNPRNPRSLFGLWKSLQAQNKTYEADIIQRQFAAAWRNADTKLRIEDL